MKTLSLCLSAVALAVFVGLVSAQEPSAKPDDKANTHDGRIVSVTGNKLVMSDLDGKNEHTMTVATDARIRCDGKECKLSDLKPGQKIRVSTKADDKTAATRVEALDKNKDFEKTPTDK